MAITTINQDNFEEKVTNAASPVLLDFWAAWCGPCTMLSPVVEELAQEHPEISFGKVNVDDVPELAQKYQISAIPTLLLFRDGKPVDMSIGVKSKEELEAFLKYVTDPKISSYSHTLIHGPKQGALQYGVPPALTLGEKQRTMHTCPQMFWHCVTSPEKSGMMETFSGERMRRYV